MTPKTSQVYLSAELTTISNAGDPETKIITLSNGDITITISSLGCTIVSLFTPDRGGKKNNIVAGFADLHDYQNNELYFGCIVGRYANRIADGKFSVNDCQYQLTLNDGQNHLHGGANGLHTKQWAVSSIIRNKNEAGVVFEYYSKDGEEGYPGNLHIKVKYLLNDKNQFSIHYYSTTDKSTPINLTNHSYFNLTGFETSHVLDHVLQIHAPYYTPKNIHNIPCGAIEAVADTPFDFTMRTLIGKCIHDLQADKGFDHNYVFANNHIGEVRLVAELNEPGSGRMLKVFTDKPAMQLYTANFWNGKITGQQGVPYVIHGGVALETQSYPDSPNQPNFPSTIIQPGEDYRFTTIYEFGISNN